MTAMNLHFVAQMSVERLLNCVVEGMVIALFAWLLLRVIGRRNSGTRFAVWFCALLAIAAAPLLETSTPTASAMIHPAAAIIMPRTWSWYLFAAWAAVAMIGLGRVAAGVWHLRVIRQDCTPLDWHGLDPIVRHTLEEFRAARRVELYASEGLRVPTAIGFLKPAIVLPSWTLRDLSAAELNAVVLHELAHLRRRDDWTNLAQKVLRALFFFHPAVWWVESRLSLEREMACDDIVLAQTANPRAYAECLVSLAEKNLLQRSIALAQAAVGRMRQTSLRVSQILDTRRANGVRAWKPAPWVIAGFSVACLVSAAHAPRLVAFGDPNLAPSQLNATATGISPSASRALVPAVIPASFVSHEGDAIASPKARKSNGSAIIGGRAGASSASRFTAAGWQAVQHANHRSDRQYAGAVRLVRTGTTESRQIAVPQQAVFVFVQGQQLGDGPVLWQVSIWRLTVIAPSAPQAAPEASSKST
ncbi:MAG: M56 family metallopeptidase [Terriglobales bacterium]